MKEYHIVLVQKDIMAEKYLPCYTRVKAAVNLFDTCKAYPGMTFVSVYITESPADALAIYEKLEKDYLKAGTHKLGNIIA